MKFESLALLPEELRLLRRLKMFGPQPIDESHVRQLLVWGLIEDVPHSQADGSLRFKISKSGQRYLIWRREDNFRHRWPVYLAILALIVSAIALITSLVGQSIPVCTS